uniref:Btz domain-containing protein n=1 Tax=Syphacia muris TaxID=451379 RepID=A0A0N5AQB7_9BILA
MRHDDEIEKTKNFGKAAGYSEQATDYDLEDKIVVRWNVQKGERHGRHDLAKPENRRESFHGMKDANSAHRNDLNTSAYPDSGANGSSAHGPQQRLHHDGNSQMHRDRPQQRIHYDEAQQLVHHDSNPQMHYDNNPRLHSDRLQRQMEYEANSRIHYNGAQQQMHRDVNPTQHTPKSVVDNSSTQGFGAEAQETQRTFDFYNFKTKPTIYNMKSSAPAAAEGANENGGAQNPTQLENALETYSFLPLQHLKK